MSWKHERSPANIDMCLLHYIEIDIVTVTDRQTRTDSVLCVESRDIFLLGALVVPMSMTGRKSFHIIT